MEIIIIIIIIRTVHGTKTPIQSSKRHRFRRSLDSPKYLPVNGLSWDRGNSAGVSWIKLKTATALIYLATH